MSHNWWIINFIASDILDWTKAYFPLPPRRYNQKIHMEIIWYNSYQFAFHDHLNRSLFCHLIYSLKVTKSRDWVHVIGWTWSEVTGDWKWGWGQKTYINLQSRRDSDDNMHSWIENQPGPENMTRPYHRWLNSFAIPIFASYKWRHRKSNHLKTKAILLTLLLDMLPKVMIELCLLGKPPFNRW